MEPIIPSADCFGRVKAVVAAIPTALDGRARKWFRSLKSELKNPKMTTANGWVILLEKAFPINRIEARRIAKNRKYNPATDEAIMDYVWDKIELLRAADRRIEDEDIVDELWLGLPDELRLILTRGNAPNVD
jgi:hypothetical protein